MVTATLSRVRNLPTLTYLNRMTTSLGVYEHAEHTTPRTEHGYCTDDASRALVAALRDRNNSPAAERIEQAAFNFVTDAQTPAGTFRNRRNSEGRWEDAGSTEDHWGRAIWSLGIAANLSQKTDIRQKAIQSAEAGLKLRSMWPRSSAYAGLGAVDLLKTQPENPTAQKFVEDLAQDLERPGKHSWTWPENNLTYANAALAEVRIAVGVQVGDVELLEDGLEMLEWLYRIQTPNQHLSLVPVGGMREGQRAGGFDQQPIEAATLAEAAWRAWEITGDRKWVTVIKNCQNWLDGLNDTGEVMWNPRIGSGFDGLEKDGVNTNQGAESTIAALTIAQLWAQCPSM